MMRGEISNQIQMLMKQKLNFGKIYIPKKNMFFQVRTETMKKQFLLVLTLLIKLMKLKPNPEKTSGFTEVDRKSTRLNSSHVRISYAVFCLKKKKKKNKKKTNK